MHGIVYSTVKVVVQRILVHNSGIRAERPKFGIALCTCKSLVKGDTFDYKSQSIPFNSTIGAIMIRWLMDDITFCTSDCDRRDCYRHPTNIQNPTIPHSFSTLKGTEHCPIYEAYADENGVGFRIKNGKAVDKN